MMTMMTTVCCKHVSLRVTSTGTSYQYTTTTMITIMMMMMTIIGAGDRAQAGKMAFDLTYGGQEDCAGIVTIVFITFVSITVVIITFGHHHHGQVGVGVYYPSGLTTICVDARPLTEPLRPIDVATGHDSFCITKVIIIFIIIIILRIIIKQLLFQSVWMQGISQRLRKQMFCRARIFLEY